MNWQRYLPPSEDQYSTFSKNDTLGCVSFSAIHCIEAQEVRRFGRTFEYSERALATLSGTGYPSSGVGHPGSQPHGFLGNSYQNVVNAIKKYGLVLEKDWPTLQDFHYLDEFYAPIPPEILAKAIPVDVEFRTSNLDWNLAPYWTELNYTSTTHSVEQLNDTQFFDSYEQYVKPIVSPIVHQYQLILKSMSNAQFVHKAGTSEYGFYLPALTTDELKGKALNFGVPIADDNGNIDFTKAKEVQGL